MLKSSASRHFLNNSYFFVSHIVTKQKLCFVRILNFLENLIFFGDFSLSKNKKRTAIKNITKQRML